MNGPSFVETNASDRDRILTASKRKNRREDDLLLRTFGAWCDFCGERDHVVLQVDHIMPVGTTGRVAAFRRQLLSRLRDGDESPFNLHLLCANCHARKTDVERGRTLPFIAVRSRRTGPRKCLLCKVRLVPGREVNWSHYCRACLLLTRGRRPFFKRDLNGGRLPAPPGPLPRAMR